MPEKSDRADVHNACDCVCDMFKFKSGMIVTMGKDKTIWKTQNAFIRSQIFDINAKDTTGAGDAFNSGIIHAYFYKNRSPEDALYFANACAALKCTLPGPRFTADIKDIQTFIKTHSLREDPLKEN